MLTSYYRYFFAIFVLFAVFNADATVVNDLYSAKIPVAQQNTQTRIPAIRKAFQAVLVKVSGNSKGIQNPILQQAFAKADDYVQQYSYRSNDNNNDGTHPYLLLVSFAPNAINSLLLKAKLPVWGADRPLTLFWIATSVAHQEKLISANDPGPIPNLIEQYADARGMPVIFPLLDLTDLKQIAVSDVMAPFVTSITQASVRYGSNAVAILRFIKMNNQWQTIWTLVSNSNTLSWTIKGSDLTSIVQTGINDISDALASQFALTGAAQQSKLNLQISGIDNLAAYARVRKYLSHLAIVTNVDLLQVNATQVTFQLNVVGSLAALQQAIKLDHLLTPSGYAMDLAKQVANTQSDDDTTKPVALTLAYRWTP